MISSTLVYRRMAFNVVFFLSLLTLHNICANDFTEPKDESILEIIKHADAEEGIHPRRNSGQVTLKPPTISESIKDVRKDAKPEAQEKSFHINNLEDEDNDHVIPPRPMNFQGRAKILRDDHAHLPSEEEYERNHVEVELTEDIKEVELTEDTKEVELSEDTKEVELSEDTKEVELSNDTKEVDLTEDIKEAIDPEEEIELREDGNDEEIEPNCTLPYEVGKCRASKPRFYFNVKSGTCEQFIYGGCGGNGNNYMTKTDCEENCITSPDGASNST